MSLNTCLLNQVQRFQLEQAVAVELGCNLADVSVSSVGNELFLNFQQNGSLKVISLPQNGEYWEYRNAISKSVH